MGGISYGFFMGQLNPCWEIKLSVRDNFEKWRVLNKRTLVYNSGNFKPEEQLKFGRQTRKPHRLSVKSGLNCFRLRVAATGVDEAEHKKCSLGGCEDEAETLLAQVDRKFLMKITTSPGTFPETAPNPYFLSTRKLLGSRRPTAAPLFYQINVQIARQPVTSPFLQSQEPGAAADRTRRTPWRTLSRQQSTPRRQEERGRGKTKGADIALHELYVVQRFSKFGPVNLVRFTWIIFWIWLSFWTRVRYGISWSSLRTGWRSAAGPLDAPRGAPDGVVAKVDVGRGAIRWLHPVGQLLEVPPHLLHHLGSVGQVVSIYQVHL